MNPGGTAASQRSIPRSSESVSTVTRTEVSSIPCSAARSWYPIARQAPSAELSRTLGVGAEPSPPNAGRRSLAIVHPPASVSQRSPSTNVVTDEPVWRPKSGRRASVAVQSLQCVGDPLPRLALDHCVLLAPPIT